MGSGPITITPAGTQVALSSRGSVLLTNLSAAATMWLDSDPNPSAASNDYVLTAGGSITWPADKPLYAAADQAAQLNVAYNAREVFDPSAVANAVAVTGASTQTVTELIASSSLSAAALQLTLPPWANTLIAYIVATFPGFTGSDVKMFYGGSGGAPVTIRRDLAVAPNLYQGGSYADVLVWTIPIDAAGRLMSNISFTPPSIVSDCAIIATSEQLPEYAYNMATVALSGAVPFDAGTINGNTYSFTATLVAATNQFYPLPMHTGTVELDVTNGPQNPITTVRIQEINSTGTWTDSARFVEPGNAIAVRDTRTYTFRLGRAQARIQLVSTLGTTCSAMLRFTPNDRSWA